ncbi:DUF2336 domain-containing protein [Sphingobium terrigena]|uniref:DUF2336 domain-containing protein n=1 Tax=Sphingobium terrigena TaxID=2304063 RepID=A0A418YWY3_9SPHN|nr:DUF2336 domain-containing protein [Sphingobium terrigena]RJG57115.1 DUF2336 domain-containing protein [Sphingobium terrigena]
MNAYSSLTGAAMADSWPMAQVMAGMSAVPVGHAIDLAFFFPVEDRAPHDALIAETRRHLAGCLNAIEMALRLSLDHAPDVAHILSRSPEPLCWPTVRAQPTLLGPALLAHMQMRAGVSLMLRQFGQPDIEHLDDGDGDVLALGDDPLIGEALSALALAEGRWIATGGEDRPMRPDLPAEYFAELVWTAAACLAAMVQRSTPDLGDAVLVAFERSGWALLADHEESASPIAEADRLVRRMGDLADSPELMGVALGQRRFLLFAALAARRLRMATGQATDILVMGPLRQVAMLCRALGGSDADYRHLLLALRPVRPSLSDAAIVAEAERYQGLTEAHADSAVSALRTPPAFRSRLDHLRRVTGA